MSTVTDHENVGLGERLGIVSGVGRHGERKQTAAIASARVKPRDIVRAGWTTSTSVPVTVMLGSDRAGLLATWLPRLTLENGFDLQGGPVTDPACIASALERRKPRVLLLDKTLLDRLDTPSVRLIHKPSAPVRVLLLCDEESDNLAADVLGNRFYGFLLKDCPPNMLLKAIRAVAQGEIWLPRASLAKALTQLQQWPEMSETRVEDDSVAGTFTLGALTSRENQIVSLVRRGWTNKQIARHLGIMEDTVKKHLQNTFTKLGVHRRTLVVLGQIAGGMPTAWTPARVSASARVQATVNKVCEPTSSPQVASPRSTRVWGQSPGRPRD